MTTINLKLSQVVAPIRTNQNSVPSFEKRLNEALQTGLKMLSFAQDTSQSDLKRVADLLSKQMSKISSANFLADPEAFTFALNTLFDPRSLGPLLASVNNR
jgi:hypothetical protein